ncbi:MAG: hypothetical protein GQ534_06510 [Candidatus Delongbacteria bacterium]|nr:hypothetical protein [Candidatus Delongbacteria bacterium]
MKERKKIRLNGYNYNKLGYYFVTICTQDKATSFGKIKNNEMIFSKVGNIANELWKTIPDHFMNAKLDKYIIMPNHIHGIIIINNDSVGDADLRPYGKYCTNKPLYPEIIQRYI